MAIRCPLLDVSIPGSDVKKSPTARAHILYTTSMPPKRKSSTPITCLSYKVFEDKSRGIVCYKDDQGQVICEGYDEGPRFYQPGFPKLHGNREFRMPDFLQPTMLQFTEGAEFRPIKLGAALKDEGLDCMDLNGLH